MIGTTILHFRITEKLGSGGMGVVYKAEDTNLNRQVAIKVLPELFSGDPERMARFEREAKLLASLNHRDIAAIHDLELAERVRTWLCCPGLEKTRIPKVQKRDSKT